MLGLFASWVLEIWFIMIVGIFSTKFDMDWLREVSATLKDFDFVWVPMIQILTTPPMRKMIFSPLKENWEILLKQRKQDIKMGTVVPWMFLPFAWSDIYISNFELNCISLNIVLISNHQSAFLIHWPKVLFKWVFHLINVWFNFHV